MKPLINLKSLNFNTNNSFRAEANSNKRASCSVKKAYRRSLSDFPEHGPMFQKANIGISMKPRDKHVINPLKDGYSLWSNVNGVNIKTKNRSHPMFGKREKAFRRRDLRLENEQTCGRKFQSFAQLYNCHQSKNRCDGTISVML